MVFENKTHGLCSILRLHLKNTTGADGDEVTPVPIPNTEVKLISVENTWLETAREDRAAPALFYGPLAQLVEQLTLNQWVQGSSP